MRKRIIISCIVSVFSAIALFGFFAMDAHSHEHTGCIASVMAGVACPLQQDATDFASFHLRAFKQVTSLIFTHGLELLTTLLFCGALLFLSRIRGSPREGSLSISPRSRFCAPISFQYLKWLALRYHADPA